MNNFLIATVFGMLQGFTEFLPVSSSAHLVFAKSLLGIKSTGALFEAILHLGTLLAIVWAYKEKIRSLSTNQLKILFIGSIPAGVVGITMRDGIEGFFSNVKLVSFFLIVTALINFLSDRYSGRKREPDLLDALVIGFAQAFAILPGISRSGVTIYAGKAMKMSPEKAAEFSFLLSIPAVLGANLVEISTHGFNGDLPITVYLFSLFVSFVSGVLAIKVVLRTLRSGKFKYFSAYCLLLGFIGLLFL